MYLPVTQYSPQHSRNLRPVAMWLFASAVALAMLSAVVAAPLATATGYGSLAATIYRAFSYVCHQIPERSYFVSGHPLAICSRCTGLYVGFTVTTVIYPILKSLRETRTPDRKWLFLAAAPMAIDVTLEFFGILDNTHASRFATGALLGAVAVLYVMPGLLELSLRRWSRSPTDPDTNAIIGNPTSSSTTAASTLSDYSAPHRRI